ncbi:putative 2-isopropylmalate synthase-like [Daphnia sinensis]|uniref:2-isopropylmalate synthase n=1 Tax=Daphnia sinensis TaxID=1820382 RepID=A0AAD5KF21_9CRUS|nr:putative 2-isopropylmalate synthase-like [Daphnia sinensis]
MSDKLWIFDTTLRDGEQVPGCQLNTQEKIVVAKALEALGVDIIEAGFPISSRSCRENIDVAGQSLKFAKRGRIHTGIGVSPSPYPIQTQIYSRRYHQAWCSSSEVCTEICRGCGVLCRRSGRADHDFLARIIEEVIKAGATVVNIPDTTGYCLPEQYGAIIAHLRNNVPNIDKAIIATHCHNDLGMATANTISGVQNGARQVEVTINGIGERAGNTSMEEVVMAIKCHQSIPVHTQIVTPLIYQTSRLVSKLMNMPVQANKAIVGRNAFAHSSGIHQDGSIKTSRKLRNIDPKDVGVDASTIVLTARSGRAALKHHLDALGVELEGKFKEDSTFIELEKVAYSADGAINANVILKVGSESLQASSEGVGPVDAVLKAIEKIVKPKVELEEFLIQAITHGSDDVAKVHMRLIKGEKPYYGFASNADIVLASAEAFVDALNKIP